MELHINANRIKHRRENQLLINQAWRSREMCETFNFAPHQHPESSNPMTPVTNKTQKIQIQRISFTSTTRNRAIDQRQKHQSEKRSQYSVNSNVHKIGQPRCCSTPKQSMSTTLRDRSSSAKKREYFLTVVSRLPCFKEIKTPKQ